MARAGIVLGVLISSPSDVIAERATILTAIYDWNSTHSRDVGIVLEPIQWETHAYPESGDRPQAIINKQIVDESDMVIAVFGHRIGTPTGEAQSGTIEEIERLRQKGKHVAVYFSNAAIPREHDPEQLRLLNEYRRSLKENTLYWTFDSTEDLYRLASQHLARSVSRLYQDLQTSGTIRVLASQLPGAVGGSDLNASAASGQQSPAAPEFKLEHQVVGEYPDGPNLRLRGNRHFELRQVDYLDENGVRVATEVKSYAGYSFDVPVDHANLVKILNLKPRSGNEAIPMQFRLRLVVDGREETRTVPALMQPSFKPINDATTYFVKLIG